MCNNFLACQEVKIEVLKPAEVKMPPAADSVYKGSSGAAGSTYHTELKQLA
jgi:hypothetical protein